MSLSPVQREFVYLLCWIVGSGVAAWVVGIVWRKGVVPITRRTRTRFDAELAVSVAGYAQWVALAAVLYYGVTIVFSGPEPEFAPYRTHQLWRTVVGLCYVNLVLAITMAVYSLVHGVVNWYANQFAKRTHSRLDDQVVRLFNRFAKVLVLFIAATVVFQHFEIKITGILATAGLASLAVALAAQDTLSNMFAGITLMFDRPFKRGDRITLPSGEWGDVLEIGLRSTKVLSFDQTVIVLPNAEIAKAQVVNHNAPDQKVKIRHTVGVAYGSDMRKVKGIVMEILLEHPDILDDPPQEVFFTEFGDSALNLLIVFWIFDYRERFRILDEVNMAIKDRFEAADIEIPFPQHDVWMRSAGPAPTGAPEGAD